jgi:hypothetical protein
MNLDDYLSLFPAYTRDRPRFIALAGAVLRQVMDLMDLVPQLASGFSFARAEGKQLDELGTSVGIPRRESWDDESYRRVLLKKLKLYTWDGTNERAFDFAEEGEVFVDNDDGTVTARTGLTLPAGEVMPVPVGIRVV